MILFELRCRDGHGFEAWFRDGSTYDAQAASGEIACPVCGDTRVSKAPMAPRIARGGRGDREVAGPAAAEGSGEPKEVMVQGGLRPQLEALRRHVEQHCEPVGDNFAEEARRIHYGEAPRRDIYGRATEIEAAELVEEGVNVARIPWPARTDS